MGESAVPNEKRGSKGMTGAIAAALAVILALLLVFPGFFAALFHRTDCGLVMFSDQESWSFMLNKRGTVQSWIAQAALYPSEELMEHSPAIRGFYIRQYELAGGKVEMLAGK